MDIAGAIALGAAGGLVGGLVGVGGGILFVPALALLLGLSQLSAEATSLLAIVPVAIVGTWRQRRYGNVRLGDGIIVGATSLAGVAAGTVLANAVSEEALRIAFAGLLLFTAARLAHHSLHRAGAPGRPTRL